MSGIDKIRERLKLIKQIGLSVYGNTVYFGPHGQDAGSMIHCQGGGAGYSAWVAMPGHTEAAWALVSAPEDIETLLQELDDRPEKGVVPKHLLLALANATDAFARDDLAALGTINPNVQPLVDAAIAWARRREK